MRNKLSGYILGIIEILALLQNYNLWLAPFTTSTTDGFSQTLQIVTALVSVILFVLPLAGTFLVYRNKRWGFILLAAFPLFCIFFGITALPGISLFYGAHIKLNSLFTAFTNAFVCAAAFWLFVSARSVFDKTPPADFSQSEEL